VSGRHRLGVRAIDGGVRLDVDPHVGHHGLRSARREEELRLA
jgi:hypothetical protein